MLAIVDGLTEAERLDVTDEATALSHESLAEMRRQERALARTLDREGITV